MTNRLTLAALAVSLGLSATSVAQDMPNGVKLKDGFTVLKSGLEYKVVKHGTGKKKAANTDHAELFIHVYLDDSVIFDSRKMYNATKPVPVTIQAPKANGDSKNIWEFGNLISIWPIRCQPFFIGLSAVVSIDFHETTWRKDFG